MMGPDFRAYRVGMCTASVCSSLPALDVAERMNREHPTGIDSLWALSGESFQGGEPNPCQCPDSPEHRHYLLERKRHLKIILAPVSDEHEAYVEIPTAGSWKRIAGGHMWEVVVFVRTFMKGKEYRIVHGAQCQEQVVL